MQNGEISDAKNIQGATCRQYGLAEVEPEAMVAIALETLGKSPVYGERVVLESGEKISWFFYCGDFSGKKDFYKPVHIEHLQELLPIVFKFLRMPPGSGFVVDFEGNEEIWVNKDGNIEVRR